MILEEYKHVGGTKEHYTRLEHVGSVLARVDSLKDLIELYIEISFKMAFVLWQGALSSIYWRQK